MPIAPDSASGAFFFRTRMSPPKHEARAGHAPALPARSIEVEAPFPAPASGHHEVHRLRPFAFLVGFDIEGDPLAFVQDLESRLLDSGDVHEDIASAVIRFDKPVSTLAIEEFDRTGHRHRETPLPVVARRRPHGATAGPDIRRQEKASANRPRSLQTSGEALPAATGVERQSPERG